MRSLTYEELGHVSGADSNAVQVELPGNATLTSRLEANQSTTLTFTLGDITVSEWNSGIALACGITTTGAVMMVTILSGGNIFAAAIAGWLVDEGCNALATNDWCDWGDTYY